MCACVFASHVAVRLLHARRLEKDRWDLEMEIEDVVLELEHTLRQRVLIAMNH